MKIVYIASPYTNGSQAQNVGLQIKAYMNLILMGYCPIAPLLSHFAEIYFPLPYEKWIEIDFKLIEISDIILRIEGESSGADKEVEYAEKLNKKIVYNISEL